MALRLFIHKLNQQTRLTLPNFSSTAPNSLPSSFFLLLPLLGRGARLIGKNRIRNRLIELHVRYRLG